MPAAFLTDHGWPLSPLRRRFTFAAPTPKGGQLLVATTIHVAD